MEQNNKNYLSEILAIIRGTASPEVMCEQLSNYHENDIADAFRELTALERQKICRILSLDSVSDVFEYLEEDEAAEYLQEIDLKKAAAILSRMETDAVTAIIKLIPKEKRMLLLQLVDEKTQADISAIAVFDEDEIGSHATTNYICIPRNLTVKQAMSELIDQAEQNDNISTIFVTTEDNTFYGAIDLPDLIRARQNMELEKKIVTSYPYVYGEELISDCIETLRDYSENMIPVLDTENHILGVITSQTIIELIGDTMAEDYVMLAGLTAEEDLQEPLKESMKKRLPWLVILLVLGMLVSSVVGAFENVVSQLPIIMAFQSLILDMAGNVGTQSLAVTIRVLMDENLSAKQKLKLVTKEMRIGFSNGLILGILSFAAIGLFIFLVKGKTLPVAYAISGCIGISLLVAMVISSLVGTCIPMFFKKIGVDPAVASGPLITTVNDLVAVVTYYGLSWILLLQVLQL